MLIKRPLTEAQKKILANRTKPSEEAQLQAMKAFVDYAALKLGELEDKVNANLSPIQSK